MSRIADVVKLVINSPAVNLIVIAKATHAMLYRPVYVVQTIHATRLRCPQTASSLIDRITCNELLSKKGRRINKIGTSLTAMKELGKDIRDY